MEYQALKNDYNSLTSRTRKSYFNSKFEQFKTSTQVWDTMNELTNFRYKSSKCISKLVDDNGEVIEGNEGICNKLASEFIVSSSISDVNRLTQLVSDYNDTFLLKEENYDECKISEKEVLDAIGYVKKSCDDSKSIPRRIYKEFISVLISPIKYIFNAILEKNELPVSFKTATCVPLYKGRGKYSSSSSYRAIYGLNFLSKVFERVIYVRLLDTVEPLLSNRQHGFRAKRSCETAVGYFTQSIFDIIDNRNGKALAVFVDFKKAFDSINHEKFIKKLMTKFDNRIEPYMIRFFQNYFSNRQFRIKNGDFYSDYYDIGAGCPAGSGIGPIIFSLFINDIADALNLPFVLFADDLTFFTDASDIGEGIKKINECYKKLCEWCDENDLTVNPSKTKAMLFYKANDYRSKNLLSNSLSLNNTEIEVVKSFKYLGVTIDGVLSFSEHYATTEKKLTVALKRMYSLRRNFTPNVIKIFISCYVVSIVDYCVCIWSVQTPNQLALLQNRIDRFVLDYFYPNFRKRKNKCKVKTIIVDSLLDKIDLLKIHERRKVFLLKFIAKVSTLPMYEHWFIRRIPFSESKLSRFVVPAIKSERYKNSVVWSAIDLWNSLFNKIKPSDVIGYPVFMEKCRALIIGERTKV